MDLKNFEEVDEKISAAKEQANTSLKKTNDILNESDHDDADKILNELEARLAKMDKAEGKDTTADVYSDSQMNNGDLTDEEQAVENAIEKDSETFLDKIRPFILPIFLTIFALIFSAIFMYFFSKSRVQETAQAIVNNNAQPEVIIIKEEKPVVKEEPVIVEEEPEPEPEPVATSTPKAVFENGTTTVLNVRFSFDKNIYDNHPRGIYLNEIQIFDGEYTDYKFLASNRAFANDYFFGVDRYMVSLIGSCKFVIDEAQILAENVSLGERPLTSIGNNYFTGRVIKVIDSSKPRISCDK